MPEVSSFYGIRIVFKYNDHVPPHFHAEYGDDDASINIRELKVDKGHLPRRALRLVLEWAALHQDELMRGWEDARAQRPLSKITPLD